MDIIRAEDICFSYKNRNSVSEALSGLSLSVKEGSFCAVVGPNGSGKSTFARILNGLLIPDSGKVYVNGLCLSDKPVIPSVRKTLGLVFQNPDSQIVGDSVEDDVAFGPENLGLPSYEIEERISFALNAVSINELRLRNPYKLSGGQKQKVAIAGVLAMGCRIIVLDEATSMLDPQSSKEVIETLRTLNREQGITVVLITNRPDECAYCDNIYVINEGKLLTEGTPKQVFSEYDRLIKLGVGIPEATELGLKYGVEKTVTTEEELEEELRILCKNAGNRPVCAKEISKCSKI